jgi:serine/threonine-protein kinase RsbW
LRFVFQSDLRELPAVQKRILDEVERHHFTPDAVFAIKLSLEEALINAVKHGNKLDREKKVRVDVEISAQRFEITIEDEGEGFERSSVPDPRLDENLEKLHGRGLLLMEEYMDEVQYSAGGRRIRMVLRNEKPPKDH